MKILMLILSTDGGTNNIYTELETIKRKYIHTNKSIEAYFYKANPNIVNEYEISGDIIYVKTEEAYPYLWKKFWLVLKALEHRLNEFDYISRPNASTFIILDRYLKHLETLPKRRCCSGPIHHGGQAIPFPAGYLFTISRDIAIHFLYNNIIKDNHGIDDRGVGIILNKLNIPIINVKYIEINDIHKQRETLMNEVLNDNIFMVRVRHFNNSSTNAFGIDTPNRLIDDISVHKLLLKKFYDME